MNIGKAIRDLRKWKGIKQKDLAFQAGMSVNSLCSIETNSTFPKKKSIEALARVLDVPESYILYFSVDINDIPEDKRKVFLQLNEVIKELLLQPIK